MACILPAGAIARPRHGRRAAFLATACCWSAALAVVLGSFWLFCLGTFFGAYAAVVLSFRFAAADGVSPERRARARPSSWAAACWRGRPQLVTHTMYLWPAHMFAATFIVQAAVAAASALVLLGVRLPMPARPRRPAAGRWHHRAPAALSPRWSAAPSPC